MSDTSTPGGRLPNLVIAGVTKAGTTSLFRYLAQHPDIQPSDEKELRHFLPLRYDEPIGTLEEYAAHFAGWSGERYSMEASPGYFYGGAKVAGPMASALPDVKVIVLLREPGQRAFSFFNFMRSRATLPQDAQFEPWLDKAMELIAEGTDQDRTNHPWSGVGASMYDRWIDDWTGVFGDRLLLLFFDDLARAPQETVKRVCAWLGIDEAPADAFDFEIENKTRQFRFARLQKAALRINRANVLFLERHTRIKRTIRRAYFLVNFQKGGGGIAPATRERLDAFYRPTRAHVLAALRPDERAHAPHWLTKT
ncbi:MAG: sulfotransferase [Dermatophilaceae bacterium]